MFDCFSLCLFDCFGFCLFDWFGFCLFDCFCFCLFYCFVCFIDCIGFCLFDCFGFCLFDCFACLIVLVFCLFDCFGLLFLYLLYTNKQPFLWFNYLSYRSCVALILILVWSPIYFHGFSWKESCGFMHNTQSNNDLLMKSAISRIVSYQNISKIYYTFILRRMSLVKRPSGG